MSLCGNKVTILAKNADMTLHAPSGIHSQSNIFHVKEIAQGFQPGTFR